MAKVTIIGAGITGIMTAYLLRELNPSLDLLVLDAGQEPNYEQASNGVGGNHARQVIIN